jgi:HK97 family phage prohead protease
MGMDRLKAVHDFELRELDDEGRFSGYASVFGVLDSYGTVFDKGCFKKTIKDHKGRFPLTWMHKVDVPIGDADVEEDDHGLFVKEGRLDLDVTQGKSVYSGMKKGYITQMSHTFKPIKELTISEDDGDKKIPHFKEVRLFEIAPVTANFAANEEAVITAVRAELGDRGVISSNLSLASKDRSWDAGAARKRVKTWAGGDTSKYRKAFLWVGEDPENYTAYKFPIADVIDGGLKAVPRAIYAAAARIDQAKGVDVAGIKKQITKYYHKLGEKAPWERVIIPVGMAFQMGRLTALLGEPPVGTLAGEPRRKPGDHLRECQKQLTRIERVLKGGAS